MSDDKKKHCPRHTRYYYRCNDCRRLNGLPPLDEEKVLYPDAYAEDEEEIERVIREEEPPVVRPPVRPSRPPRGPRRYSGPGFKKKSNKMKFIIVGVIILGVVAVIALLIGLPSWHAGVWLREQLYRNKAGSFDYWEFYHLNFWSSRFFFNKTALIGAVIGVLLMVLPVPERGLLKLVAMKFNRPPPSKKFAVIFWSTAGFGIFYLMGQLIDVMGNFGWGMYLAQKGTIASDLGVIPRSLAVLTDPSSLTMADIFAYQLLMLPIINYVAIILVLRFVLNAVDYIVVEEKFVSGAANVIIVIGIIFVASYLNLPTGSVNGLNVIQYWSVLLGAIGFLAGGIILFILSKVNPEMGTFSGKTAKVTAVVVFGIIVMIVIPLFISIPLAININTQNETWLRENWEKKIQKEITWTRQAAGIDTFQRVSISNLTDLDQTQQEDLDSLQNFRAFDKEAAIRIMHPQLNRYEALGDSDIVYVGNNEYWVAPKSLKMDQIDTDAVTQNTMLYGHVEGFLAMNTFTGQLLGTSEYQSIFGVIQNYPIFFGEHESAEYRSTISDLIDDTDLGTGTGAFDPDILLNTSWGTEIENYQFNYTGTPDGHLEGLEQFWFTAGLGLFSYALEQDKSSFLINRNINKRVSDILYPYLWLDPDPYLVFDHDSGRMYYAVSICTDVPINSFAKSSILRFLGVCLVDAATGELYFYQNPRMTTAAETDELYGFYEFYLDAYDWKEVPSWLMYQLRYPETLYEAQLQMDYTYHVLNPTTWKQGSDFYDRPPEGDLFYLESNIGVGQEFVGIDLVEYVGREARILAGMYVLRHGDHFGETIFYKADAVELVGPLTAREIFSTAATNELVLIENYRIGNTLLYPFHSSLYYFIPIYSSASEGSTLQLEQLRLAGLVNATNRAVAFGDSPTLAYEALNLTYATGTTQALNVSFDYSVDDSVTLPAYATGTVSVTHDYQPNYYTPTDIKVNITVLSNESIIKVHGDFVTNTTYLDGVNKYCNFTVLDAANLYPGEGRSVTFEMTAEVGGFSGVILTYYIVLIINGAIVETSALQTLTINK